MNIENLEWQKRLVVLRPVSGFLMPESIVVSSTTSPLYNYTGKNRLAESNRAVFQYTLSGSGVFDLEGRQHVLPRGVGFCCYVGDKRIAYRYPKGETEPWRFLYISYVDTQGITRALNDRFGFVFSVDPAEAQIKQCLNYGGISGQTIEIQAGVGHLFISTLIAMLADQEHKEKRRTSSSLYLVRRALQSIEENLFKPLNASLLASELNVSQEHLNRVFRAELGKTPYQYICQSKIHHACEQLRNTDCKISEIASDLGFEAGSHFSRLFKRITGVTPKTFRKSSFMPLTPFR